MAVPQSSLIRTVWILLCGMCEVCHIPSKKPHWMPDGKLTFRSKNQFRPSFQISLEESLEPFEVAAFCGWFATINPSFQTPLTLSRTSESLEPVWFFTGTPQLLASRNRTPRVASVSWFVFYFGLEFLHCEPRCASLTEPQLLLAGQKAPETSTLYIFFFYQHIIRAN